VALVLALEPDSKQAAIVRQIVRDRVGAEFVLADSKDAALAAIADRVPDLILVTALLSPRDEADLTDQLRGLDGAEHLQTLTIPLLFQATVATPKKKKRGLLSALTGDSDETPVTDGCDPAVFAREIADYIARAEEHKAEAAAARQRDARKPRKKSRRPSSASAPELTPAPPSSGSYWDWEPAPGSGTTAPSAAREQGGVEPTSATSNYSSWANPWDVSGQPAVVTEAVDEPGSLTTSEPTGVPEVDPIASLLIKPAEATAAEQLSASDINDMGSDAVKEPGSSTAPDLLEEIDLSLLLDQESPAAALAVEPDIYTLPADIVDDSPALDALRADLDRLRADRESVKAALTEARAAQHRAELAAEETTARAAEEAEQRAREAEARAREIEERAREEARVERLGRDEAERRAQEEAERREVDRAAREEAERLAREVQARMREEADTERRLREEAERLAREAEDRRARELEERRLREEAERKAREAAELQVAAERKAREEAERLAREAEERRKREFEERRVQEEAERQRALEERRLREENERKARAEAEQTVAAERKAREAAEARAEAERRGREHAERRAKEQAERIEQRAREEAAREVERAAKEAAAKAREEAKAERKAREDAERRMLAERKAREEAERRAKQEADRRTEAEARAAREAERRAAASTARARKTGLKNAGGKSAGRKAPGTRPARLKPRLHMHGKPAGQNTKRNGKARPALDEWGLYDPDKCGFGALYAKLEEIEEDDAAAENATDSEELLEQTETTARPLPGRNPRPLSMWAWRAASETPHVTPRKPNGVEPDDFRGLVTRLNIPLAVAAVRYASGARIRRVRVSPAAPETKRDSSQVIILSRKLLNAVREQPSGVRRSTAA
jgi:hypothetical protein